MIKIKGNIYIFTLRAILVWEMEGSEFLRVKHCLSRFPAKQQVRWKKLNGKIVGNDVRNSNRLYLFSLSFSSYFFTSGFRVLSYCYFFGFKNYRPWSTLYINSID